MATNSLMEVLKSSFCPGRPAISNARDTRGLSSQYDPYPTAWK